MKFSIFSAVFFLAITLALPQHATAKPKPRSKKNWTILVYLNGHNNLDRFGAMDINEMEKVGSTQDVNVVVQWASGETATKAKTTKRLYVVKDTNTTAVTSSVVQDMGTKVDMGDYNNLVSFAKWGISKYPANKYMVVVWNHGSGWRKRGAVTTKDISFDDLSGKFITTKQLGTAMSQISQTLGRKVDVYGSDACLMSMIEVATEMKDSVGVMVGSQELEPGYGWPYDKFLAKINGTTTAAELAGALTSEYLKSYTNGSQGNSDVTLSAVDLSATDGLNSAIAGLGKAIQGLSGAELNLVEKAGQDSLYFDNYDFFEGIGNDFRDLDDYLNQLESQNVISASVLDAVRSAQKKFVINNAVSTKYLKAKGISIWIPAKKEYDKFLTKYKTLKFSTATGWATALNRIVN